MNDDGEALSALEVLLLALLSAGPQTLEELTRRAGESAGNSSD
jgi:hypothetical protein